MNARAWVRARKRRESLSPGQIAKGLGVARATVLAWIERGWLSASSDWQWSPNHDLRRRIGQYRVRPRALKRLLRRPEVQLVVAKAVLRASEK